MIMMLMMIMIMTSTYNWPILSPGDCSRLARAVLGVFSVFSECFRCFRIDLFSRCNRIWGGRSRGIVQVHQYFCI